MPPANGYPLVLRPSSGSSFVVPVFPALDQTVQVQIASRMTARKFGEILGAMEPASAATLTQLMASRGDLPETLDELEERLAEDS